MFRGRVTLNTFSRREKMDRIVPLCSVAKNILIYEVNSLKSDTCSAKQNLRLHTAAISFGSSRHLLPSCIAVKLYYAKGQFNCLKKYQDKYSYIFYFSQAAMFDSVSSDTQSCFQTAFNKLSIRVP